MVAADMTPFAAVSLALSPSGGCTCAMTNVLKAIDHGLNRLYLMCGYAAAFFLIVLAVLVLLSIVSRLIGTFIPGLNTYSGYALAATTFLALAYTFTEGGHIRVAILRTALRGTPRLILEIWCYAVGSLFSCYLAWFLVRMTWVSWKFEEKSEGIDATLLWIPQSFMAIGAVVVAIAVVHSFAKLLITRDLAEVEKPTDTTMME
jgi:TRAP-type C4-dicarboxylate transport system permease small subunit